MFLMNFLAVLDIFSGEAVFCVASFCLSPCVTVKYQILNY